MNLDEVLEWYEFTNEAGIETINQISDNPGATLDGYFPERTQATPGSVIDFFTENLEDYAIAGLFYVFECQINEFLRDKIEERRIKSVIRAENPDEDLSQFEFGFLKHALNSPEYWKTEDILDVYKSIVDAQVVGHVKQIFDYRNWVAHGKCWPKPITLDPYTTYDRLNEFLTRADLN